MPKNTTQIIFECSDSFKDRIDQERIKRGTSRKKMIIEALEEYWLRSPRARKKWLLTLAFRRDDEPADFLHWTGMLREYMNRCPLAKIQLLQRVIEEDLKVHKPRQNAKPANVRAVVMKKRPYKPKRSGAKREEPFD